MVFHKTWVGNQEHPLKPPISTHCAKRGFCIALGFATDSSVISYCLAHVKHLCVGTGMKLLMEGPDVPVSPAATWQCLGWEAQQQDQGAVAS